MWGILVSVIREEKVSAILVALIFLASVRGYFWMEDTFVSRAAAAESHEQVEQRLEENIQKVEDKIDTNTAILQTHIVEFDITNAINRVETLEAEKRSIMMIEGMGMETEQSRQAKKELDNRLEHAQSYLNCLLADRPNCSHLKDRR